ncbi:MAG: type I restriction-modification enzyme R subunit C-terminal domain-containing protein [Pseudohongiellaceae bacterium]|nr:type I restriction-modification enzyme R subunit C-terminal domain-containing protein [Pseudohongiellaceae bacterium]
MTPPTDKLEAQTREEIDAKLVAAGWVVQDKKRINLHESLGVAVREFDTDTGPADYMLFIAGKACGIIEAKREGASLGHVADQSSRYATSNTKHIQRWAANDLPLPFLFEATNHVIRFRDERDPAPRSRNVFHFHRPETLKDWLEQDDTFRARLQHLPELNTKGLRDCQIDAVTGIEASLKQGKQRALLQMATGAGKTFTACTEVYRLAKFAKAKRVLFLVDRGNLGRQAHKEFQQYTTPDDGRKFTELYNAHILGAAGIGDEMKVTISTIQRMYSQLCGKEMDDEIEEHSTFEMGASSFAAQEVVYNPHIPIETFDIIIIDECHRSIYNLWSQVLDYFDAFLIGLTATPTKKTIGYFHQNVVSEYTHEDAVIDRVNVGYDIYRIKTEKSEQGGLMEAGTNIEVRDRLTKQKRWELLDEDEQYQKTQLDRSVIAPNQIRTVIQTFKDRCLPECFPGRSWVPKTLFFAKDDDHADRIVDVIREAFGEGNDFCKKVTYRVGKKGAEDTIAEFRTSPRLRIAVTVDMIATGTDIKPLECLVFMRDVRSQAYYEQMKGRGTRVIGDDVLKKVTPDAPTKTRFVLVDAVGVTETDKTETKSLESKPSVSTEKLMQQIAMGDRNPESLQTLGNRLIRLDMKLTDGQRKHINKELHAVLEQMGEPTEQANLSLVAAQLVHAGNPDFLAEKLKEKYGSDEVSDEQRKTVYDNLAEAAIKPFHNPDLRELLETLRRDTDQLIDDSADELLEVGYDAEKAQGLVKRYQQFIADHKDELDAIQLIYTKPYAQRHLSYQQIEALAEEIKQPPYNIAPLEVWKAYEQLEKAKVKGVPAKELLTNIVSLIRFSTGLSDVLEPFPELVNLRFEAWLQQQGADFNAEQQQWLQRIKDQIANNAEFEMDDFELIPECKSKGGLLKAKALFGEELGTIVRELNGYLIA